jgi:hypothetical protein
MDLVHVSEDYLELGRPVRQMLQVHLGDSHKHVVELVAREALVELELKVLDQLVKHLVVGNESLRFWRHELGLLLDQVAQKGCAVGDVDEARAVRIVIGPHFDEALDIEVGDAAAVLALDLIEALEGNGDEQIYENNQHPKDVNYEEHFAGVGATTTGRLSLLDIVCIGCALLAFIVNTRLPTELKHELVPALTRHHCDECQKCRAKSLEIQLRIHLLARLIDEFYLSEDS